MGSKGQETLIKQQRELLKRKWHFTNTYGPVERLDQLYGEALQADDLVGLAIATRPDCIGSPVMEKVKGLQANLPVALIVISVF